jgi:single-stranded DNA-binding protein
MTNVVVIEGKLTKDPQLSKTATTNRSVCNFVLMNYTKGPTSPKNYIYCEAWDLNAENLVKYCKAKSQITVTGYLRSTKFEDVTNRAKDIFKTILSATSISYGAKVPENENNNESKGENEK